MNEQETGIMIKINQLLSELYPSLEVEHAKTNEMMREYLNFKLNHPYNSMSFPDYFLVQLKAIKHIEDYTYDPTVRCEDCGRIGQFVNCSDN
jgi:formylmethanofuran dehydrogenase subunit E